MKIVLISGGEPPCKEILFEEIEDCDYIVCADSGANYLFENKITPNYLIGDFDSINTNVLEYFKNKGSKLERFPSEKDWTDTEIAINLAIKLGATNIVMLGCTGTRIDHLFGNLGLLKRCYNLGVIATLKDNHNEITFIKSGAKLNGKRGEIFSLQSLGDYIENLSIEGAKYPLFNHNLKTGDCLTISNEFLDGKVEIKFNGEVILFMRCKD